MAVRLKIDEQLLGKKQRKVMYEAANHLFKQIASNKILRNEIWPSVKTVSFQNAPQLILQPLDRIGSEVGKSGVKVFSGRFQGTYSNINLPLPSNQLIIKITPEESDVGSEIADRSYHNLKEERERTKEILSYFDDEFFAKPIELYVDDTEKVAVLWAPCKSPDNQTLLKEEWKHGNIIDMNMYLSPSGRYFRDHQRLKMLEKMISAIGCLKSAHLYRTDCNREDARLLVDHYAWELRGWDSDDWSIPWKELWGIGERTEDFGKIWHNPVYLFEKIKEEKYFPVHTGCIHGDLHPRNVVLGQDGKVFVIDFGWARTNQHVVKDYVLMEANLRFMTLPPYLSNLEIERFLSWVGGKSCEIEITSEELVMRIDQITHIRRTLIRNLASEIDWNTQYILPLWLVSLGLLKHCYASDSPWAARYSVLALTQYLVEINIIEQLA